MRLTNFLKKTIGRKLVRDGGAVLVDQGLMSLGTFIVGVLVARSVSKEDYGTYVLGWSLIVIIQGIQRALVVLPFTVFSPKMSTTECSRYLGSGLFHTSVIGILSLLTFSVTARLQIGSNQNAAPDLVQALPLLSLVILPFLLREQMRSAAIAKLDFIGSAKLNIVASILMLVVVFHLYLKNTLTLNSAYIAIAATSLLSGLLLMYKQRLSILMSPRAFWSDLIYSLQIGKWLLLNIVLVNLAYQIYPWLILWFIDSSQVAVFGACLAIAGILNPLLRGINAYVLPRMAHGYKNDDSKHLMTILWKTVAILSIPFGFWAILGSVFGEQIMIFFYTDKYVGYGALVSLLVIYVFIESISTLFTSALQALERPEVTTASLGIGATISVLLGIFLIKGFGLTGAGITAVLSSLAILMWKLWVLNKHHAFRV